jgi:hypothetical protein
MPWVSSVTPRKWYQSVLKEAKTFTFFILSDSQYVKLTLFDDKCRVQLMQTFKMDKELVSCRISLASVPSW